MPDKEDAPTESREPFVRIDSEKPLREAVKNLFERIPELKEINDEDDYDLPYGFW